MCGQPLTGIKYRVSVEGVELVVCEGCYRRLKSRSVDPSSIIRRRSFTRPRPVKPAPPPKPKPRPAPNRRMLDDYEVVEDYSSRVRAAREALGWSHRVLAQKLGESENVIRRIEAGRLTPTIDMARRLERILKIKLLQPIVNESVSGLGGGRDVGLTLGDIASIRRKRGT